MIYIHIKFDLKNMRHLHGITQQELSRHTGISQSHISKLSAGTVSPTLEVLAKIATALKTHPCDLINIVFEDNEHFE